MKNKLKTVGVVILNWNLANDTIKCVESLQKFIKSCNLQIVVIDNGSKEEDAIKLHRLRKVILLKNKTNIGYAKANNQGIKYLLNQKIKPNFILLMNNDAFCVDDFLAFLIMEMNSNAHLGSINPLIFYANPREKIWSSGGVIDVKHGLMSSDYYHHQKNWENCIDPYTVDWNTGCTNLIRTEALSKNGLLSERLGIYVEDVELCLRIKEKEYYCAVVPQSRIYHSVSKSSGGKGSLVSRYYISRNTVIVARMYIRNWHKFIFLNFFNQMYQSIMGGNPVRSIPLTLKGILDGLRFDI